MFYAGISATMTIALPPSLRPAPLEKAGVTAEAGSGFFEAASCSGEFIGDERGIGRLIIELEARGEASGMMVAVIVLMLVGVVLSTLIWRLQAYLLWWATPHGRVKNLLSDWMVQ